MFFFLAIFVPSVLFFFVLCGVIAVDAAVLELIFSSRLAPNVFILERQVGSWA